MIAYDLGRDHRRLEQIMTPDELAEVQFVTGDITDLPGLEATLDEGEITNVIHLAALQVPFCRADPPRGALVNVVGTVNVFEAVKRRLDRMAPVVYTSSMGVYASDDTDPVSGHLLEGAEAHPTTHYGVYKVANEGTARIYQLEGGLSSIGLRPMTVYGAGRDQGMTSGPTVAIAAAVLGLPYTIGFGGQTVFQYAEDVAGTLIAASRSAIEGAHVFNLGGEPVAIADWIGTVEALVPEAAGPAFRRRRDRVAVPVRDRPCRAGGARTVARRPRSAPGSRPSIEIFRRLAADGRLVGTEQGLPAVVAGRA